jgi:hypothetical protein
MSRRAALQTYHAIQATDLASAFNEAMKKVSLAPGDYAAELTAPEGPSTAGGVQALQHVRLAPRQQGFPTLVVGHTSNTDRTAELRTYDHLDAVHRQRFKRPLALDRARYEEFLSQAKGVLDALQFRATLAGPPADLGAGEAQGGTVPRGLIAAGIAIVLALVGLGLWRALAQ